MEAEKPYRGTAQVLPDLLSGEVQITCESLAILMPYIAQGAVRPLLVTSATRLPELPQVPTLLELGLDGYPVETWMGTRSARRYPAGCHHQAQRGRQCGDGIARDAIEPEKAWL